MISITTMFSSRVLATCSPTLRVLIGDDYPDDVCVLFADLDLNTNININDFMCIAALIDDIESEKLVCYKRWAHCRVTQQSNNNQREILSKITATIATIQDIYTTSTNLPEYARITDMIYTHITNIVTDDMNHKSSSDKYKDYITNIGIVNFISTCDKLNLRQLTSAALELNIPLHVPAMSTIINYQYKTHDDNYDSEQIINTYNNNYNILFNNHIYHGGRELWSHNNDIDTKNSNNIMITELNIYDIDTKNININTMVCQNLPNLVKLTYMNWDDDHENVPIAFDRCKSLTFLDISHFTYSDYHASRTIRYITDSYINGSCNLRVLICDNNKGITTCNPFAKSLRELSIGNSGLADEGLSECALIEKLIYNDDCHVTTCDPFAKSLRTLWIATNHYDMYASECAPNYIDTQKCENIGALRCDADANITISKLTARSLRIFSASCIITDDELLECTNIQIFVCMSNHYITSCEPFAQTLRILHASRCTNMTDYGLSKCTNIEYLDCSRNNNITTCEPFARTLRILDASDTNITDYGLSKCTNIQKLTCYNTTQITTCKPFCRTLRELWALYSNINDNGLKQCKYITFLSCDGALITNCDPFIHSLKTLVINPTSAIDTDVIRASGNNIIIEQHGYVNSHNMSELCAVHYDFFSI